MEIILQKFDYKTQLQEQRKLFIECFPENIGTPVETVGHYNWKFHTFPDSPTSYEYIAKEDNSMIGYYAAIPYSYNIFGTKSKVAMVCDVMTGFQARGKGVFTKLGVYSTEQYSKEGLAFSTGFPIRSQVIPGHLKAGWESPFTIPMYGKFLGFDSFLKTRNKQYLIPLAKIFIFFYKNLINLINTKDSNNIIVETYSSSQIQSIKGLDIFLEKWQQQNNISLVKNIQFITWRLSAPEKAYKIILLRSEENVVGYAVIREVLKENVPCVGVLDISILDAYNEYATIIFKNIDIYAQKSKAELILFMVMSHQAKKISLYKSGYIKTPYIFSFIIKIFDQKLSRTEMFDENNWNLMWIDSDDL